MKCAWLHLPAFLLVACGESAAENPLVDAVRVSNRAAIESLQTVHFRYAVRKENIRGEVTVSPTSEYWRSGSTIRDVRRAADHETDTLVLNGRLFCKSNQIDQETGKAFVTGSISRFEGMPLTAYDPWQWSMVAFFGEVNNPPVLVCFDDLLKISHRIVRAERVVEQGRPLDLIEVEFASGSSTTFWFDPAFNSLACRTRMKTVDATSSRVDVSVLEVGAFIDGGGGVYFPESVVRRRTIDGKNVSTDTIRFTEIEINKPIAPETLALTFPAGTEVHDLVVGKRCIAEANGILRVSARELSLPVFAPTVPSLPSQTPVISNRESSIPISSTDPAPEMPRTETRVEPSANSRLFYVAGFCFFGVFIALLMRHWQTLNRLKASIPRRVK